MLCLMPSIMNTVQSTAGVTIITQTLEAAIKPGRAM